MSLVGYGVSIIVKYNFFFLKRGLTRTLAVLPYLIKQEMKTTRLLGRLLFKKSLYYYIIIYIIIGMMLVYFKFVYIQLFCGLKE